MLFLKNINAIFFFLENRIFLENRNQPSFNRYLGNCKRVLSDTRFEHAANEWSGHSWKPPTKANLVVGDRITHPIIILARKKWLQICFLMISQNEITCQPFLFREESATPLQQCTSEAWITKPKQSVPPFYDFKTKKKFPLLLSPIQLCHQKVGMSEAIQGLYFSTEKKDRYCNWKNP